MIEVVNKHRLNPPELMMAKYYVNIMRGTPLGNPFKIGQDGSREEVIEKYRKWLWDRMQSETPQLKELRSLYELWGKYGHLVLACCCAPKPCHGDIVKRALIWMRDS